MNGFGSKHVQIKNVSNRHMAIIEHMIACPTQKLGEVAFLFGVSQAWLSSLVHSDLFQAKLRDRQDESFSAIALPLREKLHNLAHRSVDRLSEKVETLEEPRAIQDIAEMALETMGYGGGKEQAPAVVIHIDAESLASARNKVGRVFEGESSEVQTSGERLVGEEPEEASLVYTEKETEDRSEEEGNPLRGESPVLPL